MLGQMFIINAPMLFSATWSIVSKFIDKKTKEKITICGKDFNKKIRELVDEENLPDFLGGTCNCPMGCLNSNVGPWNPNCLPLDECGALIYPIELMPPEPVKPADYVVATSSEAPARPIKPMENTLNDYRDEDVKEINEILMFRKSLKL